MWILFSIPKCAGERIANELRMHFRRERKSGTTVSLQETLEAGKDADLVLWTADPLTTIGGERRRVFAFYA